MCDPFNAFENEEGSVVVLSLMVLVILSIVGFSASRTSTTEMQIVRNDATYQQNFYLAESGATQAAQLLSNLVNATALKKKTPTWLNAIADVDTDDDNTVDDLSTWFASSGANQTANISTITADNSVEYSVVDTGVAAGSSTAMGQPQLHNYSIVGIGNRNTRGQIAIQIGYRKIIYP